ncbi:MAG: hypothetical protein Q8N96_04805 [Methylovulum sp.]|nr:hypothetical protein [Methylovulum sp.]
MPANTQQTAEDQTYAPKKIPIIFGFFDVLAFSKRVDTEGPERIATIYHQLIETTVKKEASRCLGTVSDGTGARYPILFSLDVQTAYFSDTIFMWVPLERGFADAFVSHCATFVCEALAMGIPLRGAIALGEAVMERDTGTYIGMPIVEGALCENIQEWLGVAFAPSATWPPFMAEVNPNLFMEYDIPVKPGEETKLPPVALDWTSRWEELFRTPATTKLIELDASSPHQKLKNSIAYVEYCIQHRDWHKQPPEYFEGKRLKMMKQPNDTP